MQDPETARAATARCGSDPRNIEMLGGSRDFDTPTHLANQDGLWLRRQAIVNLRKFSKASPSL